MQTIAITIDEGTLARLDAIGKGKAMRNRSRIVREALDQYLNELERRQEEARESAVLKKHRARIAKQTDALLREQAR